MKKTVKILSIVILALMVVSTFASVVLATDPGSITIVEPADGKITNLGGRIVGFIRIIGSIIAVGILVVLGIKYMTASPEGKADYKSSMIPYIVGAVLVFAASWIASAIYGAVNGLNTGV